MFSVVQGEGDIHIAGELVEVQHTASGRQWDAAEDVAGMKSGLSLFGSFRLDGNEFTTVIQNLKNFDLWPLPTGAQYTTIVTFCD